MIWGEGVYAFAWHISPLVCVHGHGNNKRKKAVMFKIFNGLFFCEACMRLLLSGTESGEVRILC